MISFKECIACEICYTVCPTNAIAMNHNEEGFRFPVIDIDKCIGCNLCSSKCPIEGGIINEEQKIENSKYLCGHFKNKNETLKSSSGGVAAALSRAFILNGGVVISVSYSDDYRSAEFVDIITVNQIDRLRGSKYFQTRKNDMYNKIKYYIGNDKKVLVIGLPCDVGAVKSFFSSDCKESLIYYCELICHGVTSEKVLNEYQDCMKRGMNSKISNFELRYKTDRWVPFNIRMELENGKILSVPYSDSNYKKAFFMLLRPSCYECHYKGSNSQADITIGDYWGISESDKAYQKEGVSLIVKRSERLDYVLSEMHDFVFYDADPQIALACNPSLINPTCKDILRDEFSEIFIESGIETACNWLDMKRAREERKKSTMKERLKCVTRLILKKN